MAGKRARRAAAGETARFLGFCKAGVPFASRVPGQQMAPSPAFLQLARCPQAQPAISSARSAGLKVLELSPRDALTPGTKDNQGWLNPAAPHLLILAKTFPQSWNPRTPQFSGLWKSGNRCLWTAGPSSDTPFSLLSTHGCKSESSSRLVLLPRAKASACWAT